jgi:energy-coupling factor transport system substrate-specific component
MANSTSQAEGGFFSRIASDFTTRAWVLIPVGVGINFVGGTLVSVLKLPIFLDTIGTILVALLAGPWVAALTGLVTNLVLVVSDPTLIAFAPVNVAIGLIAGFLALNGWFKTYPKIVASGLIIMLTGVILSAPIVVLAFGGVTSSPSRSALTAFFLATGGSIWQSVFTTGVIVEIVDKMISVFVAVFVARAVPERYRPQKAQQTI